MDIMKKITAIAWQVIELLFQATIVLVLVALIVGEPAGVYANSVLTNVTDFLKQLPASTIAVAILLATLIWWNRR